MSKPARSSATSHEQTRKNVGDQERFASLVAGSVLSTIGMSSRGVSGLLLAGLGGALLYRGGTGHCHLYAAMNIDTAAPAAQPIEEKLNDRGIEVGQAMLIGKPAEELYRFWRRFENLPGIMHYLKSVTVIDDKRSHWVTEAPTLAGGSIEWDAEITHDEPNVAIAWRSVPGSSVDSQGEVRFTKALGDRGTEVHVTMKYLPPAGKLGHFIAKIFGESPERQVRESLRNFKQLMEAGEIPSIRGQPKGTCTGAGERAMNEH